MAMTRSSVMSRIRSKGTRLETHFRKLARHAGLRIRRADMLFGRPDFRICGTRTLIFVNSCFWHGCRWHCRMPASRQDYWGPKISGNVKRQKSVIRKLRGQGYKILVVWEHRMSCNANDLIRLLRRVRPRKLR